MTWSDKDRQLTIHPRQGSYDGMLQIVTSVSLL